MQQPDASPPEWPGARGRVKLHAIDPLTTRRRLRLSPGHLAAAVGVFLVEVAIARYVRGGLLRTFGGDVLVVPLLYFALRAVLDVAPLWAALSVFLFACAIEVGQAVQLVHRLGLEHVRLARIVIGTSYDPMDFLAYAVGTVLVLSAHFFMIRSKL